VNRRALGRLLRWAVLPVLAYLVLLHGLDRAGGVTVMLGAVSGSSVLALAAMVLALVLRLYTVLVLPAVLAGWLTARLLQRVRSGSASVRPATAEALSGAPRPPGSAR
jgi:hypothetical protein